MSRKSSSQRPSSRRTTCELDLFFASENVNLKEKNSELAKSLAESKMAYAQAIAQRDLLQRELFNESAKSNKLMNYFKTIDVKCKGTLNTLLRITDDIYEIIGATAEAQNFVNSLKVGLSTSQQRVSVSSPNRTQAVKPMVDGHVIHRPMVKLTRVNQLTNLQQIISNSNVQNTPTEPTEDEVRNNEISTSNHSVHNNSNEEINSSNLNELNPDEDSTNQENTSQSFVENNSENYRLTTLRETDEDSSSVAENNLILTNTESINITGARNPVLSGIFKEVRVYLSRDDNLSQLFSSNKASTKTKIPKFSRMSSGTGLESSNSQERINHDETPTHNNSTFEPEVSNEPSRVNGSSANNSMDYDPLEGPSTLLNDVEKIQALQRLGLEPIHLSTSTPNKEINGSRNTSSRFITLRRKVSSTKLHSSPLHRKYSSPRLSASSTTPSPSPKKKLHFDDKKDEVKSPPSKIKKSPKKLFKGKILKKNKKLSPKKSGKKRLNVASPDESRKSPRNLKDIKQKIQTAMSKGIVVNGDVNIKEEPLTPKNTSVNQILNGSVTRSPKERRTKRPVNLAEPSLRKKLRQD